MSTKDLSSFSTEELLKQKKNHTQVFYLVLGVAIFSIGLLVYGLLTKGEVNEGTMPAIIAAVLFAYVARDFWAKKQAVSEELEARKA